MVATALGASQFKVTIGRREGSVTVCQFSSSEPIAVLMVRIEEGASPAAFEAAKKVMADHPGPSPVWIQVGTDNGERATRLRSRTLHVRLQSAEHLQPRPARVRRIHALQPLDQPDGQPHRRARTQHRAVKTARRHARDRERMPVHMQQPTDHRRVAAEAAPPIVVADHDDARRITEALFRHEPFRSRRKDFNVRAIDTPAERSGISRPRAGVFRNNPLGARYNSLDSERYVLTLDDRAWRDVAAAAPYDFVLLLVNERKYGGGGIYQLYSTAAVDSAFADYLAVHEFGHHFARLGDEYYTSDVAYEDFTGETEEPWEPNITALRDPDRLKWKDLVADTTPLPTPWAKEAYEEASRRFQQRRRELRAEGAPEEALEELFREERRHFTAALGAEEHAGEIGAFEGAMYQPQGLYRPAADCIMFTRDEVGFCAVCRRAIERVIDLYSR